MTSSALRDASRSATLLGRGVTGGRPVVGPCAFRSPAKVGREVAVRALFEPKMSAVQARVHPVELVKSKRRVADHGEVFTPAWMVRAMLELVKDESERIDARFLEPACGSGNFVVPVLMRKLATVELRYGKSGFEKRHQALVALMSIYGIELLDDNVAECRQNLLEVFADYLRLEPGDEWLGAASAVLASNIVHGDALAMTTREPRPQPITFPEWSYVGKGRFRRRDFRFDTMTQRSTFGADDTLFADLGHHEIFTPTTDHGTISVADLAGMGGLGD